jgi:hypothetical protein
VLGVVALIALISCMFFASKASSAAASAPKAEAELAKVDNDKEGGNVDGDKADIVPVMIQSEI